MPEKTAISLQLAQIIPSNLDARQSMAISIACAAHFRCVSELSRLDVLAGRFHIGDEFNPSISERFEIISRLWTIVEEIDTMRQAINADKSFLADVASPEFFKIISKAREMRNHKAHLSQNINNYSKRRSYFPPLGVGKWFIVPPATISKDSYIYLVSAESQFTHNATGNPLDFRVNFIEGAQGTVRQGERSFALQLQNNSFNITYALKMADDFFKEAYRQFSSNLRELEGKDGQVARYMREFSFMIICKTD